jgi:hypothetical protein
MKMVREVILDSHYTEHPGAAAIDPSQLRLFYRDSDEHEVEIMRDIDVVDAIQNTYARGHRCLLIRWRTTEKPAASQEPEAKALESTIVVPRTAWYLKYLPQR